MKPHLMQEGRPRLSQRLRFGAALCSVLVLVLGCGDDSAGSRGPTGDAGASGEQGPAGEAGVAGEPGQSSLLKLSDVDAGADCPAGGQRIDTGLDADGDGVLSADEVTDSSYLCGNGAAASETRVVEEAPGEHCPYGGQRIDTGVDENGDDELDPETEVESSAYVCSSLPSDPKILRRVLWNDAFDEADLVRHSKDLIASAPEGSGELSLERLYKTGYDPLFFDESVNEIVVYNPSTRQVFATDSSDQYETVNYFTLESDGSLSSPGVLDIEGDVPERFGTNSVAVSGSTVAVALEVVDDHYVQLAGRIAFYDISGEEPEFIRAVEVGALPDMVTFSHDGKKVIVACEGEPPEAASGDALFDFAGDPEGSIAIINRPAGGWTDVADADVTLLDFTDFNDDGDRAEERPPQFRPIAPAPATWSQQIEPEYVAVAPDDQHAWVGLQEQNSVAIVDLENDTIERIHYLGVKDGLAPGNEFDASDFDKRPLLANWPVYLMYQPDTIRSYVAGDGEAYYVTANEGDPRNKEYFYNEDSIAGALDLDPFAFPGKDVWQASSLLGKLAVTTTAGDVDGDGLYDDLYAFGGRSFSVWNGDGELVFDSGNDFERITAKRYGPLSNQAKGLDLPDSSSAVNGPAPEALAVGSLSVPIQHADGDLPPVIEERIYAFIGIESDSGIMVYDVTRPSSAHFVTYFNTRDLAKAPSLDVNGDLAPEGIDFVSAEDSPTGTPLLICGNEVSGTVSVYEITPTLLAADVTDAGAPDAN